jgi:hypothetical protein
MSAKVQDLVPREFSEVMSSKLLQTLKGAMTANVWQQERDCVTTAT